MSFSQPVLIIVDVLLALAALFSATFARFGHSGANITLFDSVTIYSMLVFVVVVLFSSHLMEVYDHGKNVRKREILINII